MTASAGGVVTQNKELTWNNEPGDPHLYMVRNIVQCVLLNEILQVYPGENTIIYITVKYSNVEAHMTFMEPDIKTNQKSEQPYV